MRGYGNRATKAAPRETHDPKRCIQDPLEGRYRKPYRVSCHVVGSLNAAREIELGIIRCADHMGLV